LIPFSPPASAMASSAKLHPTVYFTGSRFRRFFCASRRPVSYERGPFLPAYGYITEMQQPRPPDHVAWCSKMNTGRSRDIRICEAMPSPAVDMIHRGVGVAWPGLADGGAETRGSYARHRVGGRRD
jgi:hypothetical protein